MSVDQAPSFWAVDYWAARSRILTDDISIFLGQLLRQRQQGLISWVKAFAPTPIGLDDFMTLENQMYVGAAACGLRLADSRKLQEFLGRNQCGLSSHPLSDLAVHENTVLRGNTQPFSRHIRPKRTFLDENGPKIWPFAQLVLAQTPGIDRLQRLRLTLVR